MKRFNLTKEEAIEKIEKIKNDCRKTQLNKSEFEFNAMTPSKKEHWIKKGFAEEESIILANDIIKNATLNCQTYNNIIRENPELLKDKRTTNKEYWMKKGFTIEESKQKVSQRQRTFSLDICISKYGEKDGKKIHKKRQIDW
jgi:hypothetical protein